LGNILGYFFTNSSGHPVSLAPRILETGCDNFLIDFIGIQFAVHLLYVCSVSFQCRHPKYRQSKCQQNDWKCRLHLTLPDIIPQGQGALRRR
jgi:hypothetical protein